MKKNVLYKIGLIYLIVNILYLSLSPQIFYDMYGAYIEICIEENIYRETCKEQVLINFYLRLIGILAIFVSIVFLFYLNLNRTLIFGSIGIIISGIAIILSYILYYQNPFHSGFQYFDLIILISFLSINILLVQTKSKRNIEEDLLIRRTILELGTQFTRLSVKEISEKCKRDKNAIIRVIMDMIKDKEVYAEYFKSTNMVAFNQQANIDEIDKLMESYKEWEEKEFGKK